MDRKWRTNRYAIQSVLSIIEFENILGDWKGKSKLVSLVDLYALYTVLHIEKKEWEIHWSDRCQFYYFVARETQMREEGKKMLQYDGEASLDVKSEEKERSQEVQITQLLVPVSSSNLHLTPRLLHMIPSLGHGVAHEVLLSLIDSNGVVTRCNIYDYIQAPLSSSGAAHLQPTQ